MSKTLRHRPLCVNTWKVSSLSLLRKSEMLNFPLSVVTVVRAVTQLVRPVSTSGLKRAQMGTARPSSSAGTYVVRSFR